MRVALARRHGISERKMFGGYCWLLHGNMICGVEVGRYMFRVGKDLEAEALSRPGASPMDITGKPMRGFVWVACDAPASAWLRDWINLSVRYVKTLPAKPLSEPRGKVRKVGTSGPRRKSSAER